jgi:UDP-2,3-diacylglucosamine hydrolase
MQKKTFFASDFHLGIGARHPSADRERSIVRWLHQSAPDAAAIYLVGDIFEFWHEYQHVVPKGFTRLLGTLAEIADSGIPVHAFTGNHDLWMFGYFEQELGIPVYRQPIEQIIGNKRFLIGHGDGLGPGDTGYKLMKKVFTNPVCQWAFRWLHPDLGGQLAHFASGKSREATPEAERNWLGDDKEWLLQYCNRKISQGVTPDYFVFGHRHLPIDWQLSNGQSRYINLGEWMWAYSYGVFDGNDLQISFFEREGTVISNWR